MPNLKNEQARFQFNEFTYWEHIFSLIPPEDEQMRKEVSDMVTNSVLFVNYNLPEPEGEFTVTNRLGKKETVNGEQLIYGDKNRSRYLPIDEPEYQDFFNSKLDLLDRLEEKYSGKKHENLQNEIGILRCKNKNIANGLGYELSPGQAIIIGDNGLQKFQDVLYDIDKSKKNNSDDRLKWSLTDPTIVEKTMKELGVTDIQRKYKEINEHNAEWAKEWFQGDRDPKKLRKIGEKFKKDIRELDGYIKKFEKNYLNDMKLPEKDRKMYNITKPSNCSDNEIIIDFEHSDHKKNYRGFNGKNWENHKQLFSEELERQLITAELEDLSEDVLDSMPDKLKEKIDSYIGVTDAHFDQDGLVKDYAGSYFNTPGITGIRRLMDVREEAAKTPKNKGAKKIIELADRHLKDPANAEMVKKAKEINKKHTGIAEKIEAVYNDVQKEGIENGNRLVNLYI